MSALIFGLQVAVIGFGIVFLALFALNVCIQLQEKLFIGSAKKKEDDKQEAIKIEEAIITQEVKGDNQEELIAVIAAAIAAYNLEIGNKVVVKNIKRVYGHTGVPWAAASRVDNMNLRKISAV